MRLLALIVVLVNADTFAGDALSVQLGVIHERVEIERHIHLPEV